MTPLWLDFAGGRAYLRRMKTGRLFVVLAAGLFLLCGVTDPAIQDQTPPSNPSAVALPQEPPSLPSLLAKTAEYCRKLEASAFDLACREEIRETIDPKLDAAERPAPAESGSSPFLGPSIVIRTVRKIKHSFVYDYQCVRAGRTIRETRTLLEENGKKKNVPNAKLQTSIVAWGTALLGPVRLFGERFQPEYDYAVAGEDAVDGVRAVIVDAKPRPGAPPDPKLYGRAWLDPAAGAILKIEWSEGRVGDLDVFAQRGKRFDRAPRLTLRSEFSVEKNGLRFPARFSVEEAYLKDPGQVFVRSTTEAVYKDFKFSSVAVEIAR